MTSSSATLRRRTLLVGVLAAVAFGPSACQPLPFDYAAAARLSPQTRAGYDVLLANEMVLGPFPSTRYLTERQLTTSSPQSMEWDASRRRHDIEEMAKNGHLPSYVAMYQWPEYILRYQYSRQAVDLLVQAAEQGDVSAACAMVTFDRSLYGIQGRMDLEQAKDRALKLGVSHNHGACLAYFGSQHFQSVVTEDKKILWGKYDASGFKYLYESARQGYFSAHRTLAYIRDLNMELSDYKINSAIELERMLCWGRLAAQHAGHNAGFDGTISRLKWRAHFDELNPKDVQAIIDKYDVFRVPLSRKVVSSETCLNFENGELKK